MSTENHLRDWDNVKVIDWESDRFGRVIRKAIWIKNTSNISRDRAAFGSNYCRFRFHKISKSCHKLYPYWHHSRWRELPTEPCMRQFTYWHQKLEICPEFWQRPQFVGRNVNKSTVNSCVTWYFTYNNMHDKLNHFWHSITLSNCWNCNANSVYCCA